MATKSMPNVDQLDIDGAVGWKPNPGDKLTGFLINVKASLPHDFGNGPVVYPIAVIAKEDSGELVALHMFHSVLKNRILEKKPVKGERISVKYIGEVEGKKLDSKGKPRTYNNYSVVMPDRPADEDVNWDMFTSDPSGDIA